MSSNNSFEILLHDSCALQVQILGIIFQSNVVYFIPVFRTTDWNETLIHFVVMSIYPPKTPFSKASSMHLLKIFVLR